MAEVKLWMYMNINKYIVKTVSKKYCQSISILKKWNGAVTHQMKYQFQEKLK